MNINKAKELIIKYFGDKKDKGGNPYIKHLEYVSSKGRNEEEKIIGLLHDILEDTKLTEKDLISNGFNQNIIKIIKILTRDKKNSYDEYINNIIKSNSEVALYIKKIDMEHNMDLSRIKNITEKDIERIEKKYKPNYIKICNALKVKQNTSIK